MNVQINACMNSVQEQGTGRVHEQGTGKIVQEQGTGRIVQEQGTGKSFLFSLVALCALLFSTAGMSTEAPFSDLRGNDGRVFFSMDDGYATVTSHIGQGIVLFGGAWLREGVTTIGLKVVETGTGNYKVVETGTGNYKVVETGTGNSKVVETGTGNSKVVETGTGNYKVVETGTGNAKVVDVGTGNSKGSGSASNKPSRLVTLEAGSVDLLVENGRVMGIFDNFISGESQAIDIETTGGRFEK